MLALTHMLESSYSFGSCIKSPVVRVGERSFWQARYFPKVVHTCRDCVQNLGLVVLHASYCTASVLYVTCTGIHQPGLGLALRDEYRLRAQGARCCVRVNIAHVLVHMAIS